MRRLLGRAQQVLILLGAHAFLLLKLQLVIVAALYRRLRLLNELVGEA